MLKFRLSQISSRDTFDPVLLSDGTVQYILQVIETDKKKIAEGKIHEVKGFFTHSSFLAVTNIPETPAHTREKLKALTAQQDLKIIFKSF